MHLLVVHGVDLEKDGNKAEYLVDWADSLFLPDCSSSLRSDRTIDYTFSNIPDIEIQRLHTNATSGHFPILSVLSIKLKRLICGKSIHWNVFHMFTEYTYSYWENSWSPQTFNLSYDAYIQSLHLLTASCTTTFPLRKYRVVIPPNLRCFMSYVRALSFRMIRTNNSHLFVDDLATVFADRIGKQFSTQCLDLERRIKLFCDELEFYCLLAL
ncbi:unnamed protein product [Adineta ricciae]|uniref:Uncharacterized protein n=1 Tax=Adineta ricciae TaxID=249248 RepID=A0A815D0H4_ADIRI|nr:unnamed protein product [Adineta ricciae]